MPLFQITEVTETEHDEFRITNAVIFAFKFEQLNKKQKVRSEFYFLGSYVIRCVVHVPT